MIPGVLASQLNGAEGGGGTDPLPEGTMQFETGYTPPAHDAADLQFEEE